MDCEGLAVACRGCASIVRLAPVVASLGVSGAAAAASETHAVGRTKDQSESLTGLRFVQYFPSATRCVLADPRHQYASLEIPIGSVLKRF